MQMLFLLEDSKYIYFLYRSGMEADIIQSDSIDARESEEIRLWYDLSWHILLEFSNKTYYSNIFFGHFGSVWLEVYDSLSLPR